MSRLAFGRALEAMVVSGLAMLPNAGCVNEEAEAVGGDELTARMVPVGLALEVNNGAGAPLAVRRGQTFYLNQIDLRASLTTTVDEGVSGLRAHGDFAGFQWSGITREEQEFILLANLDGTFRRRQFYRDAVWMNENSVFVLEQVDASGRRSRAPVIVETGVERARSASDGFFDRRIRAIQWTNDCKTVIDCTGATAFEEEAIVELRYGMHPDRVFAIAPDTAALRVTWSLRPTRPYTIPVTQVAAPPLGYGASVDVEPVTRPSADGSYPPGSDVTFRITLRDGAGNRLHPPGTLPTYNEVVFGGNPAGIQYYRAFFDQTTTYWRRKHRERMLMAQLVGPAQAIQPIRSIIDLDKFLNADDVQLVGTVARDGMFAEFHTFPTAHDLFGGAFDPAHAGWAALVPDTWTHHLPADAPAGTYLMTVKGRRTYLGEDVPFSRTIELQVGSPRRTQATLGTGPCNTCHDGPSALGSVLHASANRSACGGCHVPLGFELEGPIYVRTHFIHSRSRRLDASLAECAACHLTRSSIQRVSKSACLSCHRSYPPWHVAVFGPIQSIYVGGGRESFEQCTSACHRSHPHSRL